MGFYHLGRFPVPLIPLFCTHCLFRFLVSISISMARYNLRDEAYFVVSDEVGIPDTNRDRSGSDRSLWWGELGLLLLIGIALLHSVLSYSTEVLSPLALFFFSRAHLSYQ
jgi:hypothetical protein